MFSKLRLSFSLVMLIFAVAPASSQVATGAPPFGSLGGGSFDAINLGNLNVHFAVPIVHKAGVGMPFTYDFSYDSSIWYPSNGVWAHDPNWGWRGVSEALVGVLTVNKSPISCELGPQDKGTLLYWFEYHDPAGAIHRITLNYNTCDGPSDFWVSASDGSGYAIHIVVTVNNHVWGYTATLYSRSGNAITPDGGSGAGQIADPNGNTLFAANSSGVTTFTDTLGTPTLKVTNLTGTTTRPQTFSYLVPSTTGYTYTDVGVTYVTKDVKTSFACTGTVTDVTIPSVLLISKIGPFPDNSSYSFTYEQTPNDSAHTTGRIEKVTLPSGGTITYKYTNTGTNDGVNCADGSTVNMTRTLVPDGAWTYARTAGSGSQWTTQVTTPPDPVNTGSASDVTVLQFQVSGSSFYETERQIYQGDTSTAPLGTAFRCYNNPGITDPTNCPTTAVVPPISQLSAFWQLQNNSLSRSLTIYSPTTGLLAQDKEFDFVSGALLRNTVWTYAPASGTNILDRPACVQTTAATTPSTCGTITSDTVSATTFSGYDANGNVGTVSNWMSGVTTPKWLSRSFSGYVKGLPATVTDVNGAATGFTYGDCGGAFPTAIAEPLTLSRSMHWDCNGGVPLWAKNENGKQTTYNTYDAEWRLTDLLYPDGGDMQTTYNTGASSWSVTTSTLRSGTSRVTTEVDYDGLARAAHSKLTSDPVDNDTIDTTYDALGRVACVTNPHRSTGSQTDGTTCYGYDALGRIASVGTTHAISRSDGSHVDVYPYLRAVDVVGEGSNGNGTTPTSRIYQNDALGRLSAVCEVSSTPQFPNNTQPTNCGLDIDGPPLKGFKTSYWYDALGNLTQVSQAGLGNRNYAYDGLSRFTSESNPESGATTYTYDAAGSEGDLSTRIRPKANQTSTATTTTTYYHDKLHRLTGVDYGDAGQSLTWPLIFNYDQSSAFGHTLVNYKGRLTSAVSANAYASTTFSYDTMGRPVDEWQCTPIQGQNCASGNVHLQLLYDNMGNMTSLKNFSDGTGTGVTYSYPYNNAAELTGVTSDRIGTGYPGTLLSVSSFNPLGQPVQESRGDSQTTTLGYNSRGFLTSKQVGTSGSLYNFALTYAPNGNVATGNDSINGNWSYTYDDLNRLSTSCQPATSCPSSPTQAFQYLYDQFGNRWQQNVTAGQGFNTRYTFNSNNQISGGVTYDKAGNETNDGVHQYAYDAEGRVEAVDTNSRYNAYDAFGNRIHESAVGSTDTDWVFGPSGKPIWGFTAATQTTGGILSEIYAGGSHVATYSGTSTYFEYGDSLGSVRTHTKVGGPLTPADLCQNLSFGDGLACAGGALPDSMHFTDQILDPDGLSHFWFRDYSSTQGRWVVPDPAGVEAADPADPQSLNRYAYALNNPMTFIDPLGLKTIIIKTCTIIDEFEHTICYWYVVDSPDPNTARDDCPPSKKDCNKDPGKKAAHAKCLKNGYGTSEGKAIQFLSPLSTIRGWNPDWKNNAKDWGISIFGKGLGLLGSGFSKVTQEVTTLAGNQSLNLGWFESGATATINATERAGPWAIGGATIADLLLHAQCILDPNAPLDGIVVGPK